MKEKLNTIPKEYYKNNKWVTIIWEFKNKYWEEFIIYKLNIVPSLRYITWDLLEWDHLWNIDKAGKVHKWFILSKDEINEALNILVRS